MNTFLPVRVAAIENRLPEHLVPMRGYLASDAFIERASFEGPNGPADSVAVTLLLLGRLALDPRLLDETERAFRAGVIAPHYFGVTNPVPLYSVLQGGLDHHRLEAALQANRGSQMFDAAQRALRWRQPDKVRARATWVDQVVSRAGVDWPTSAEWDRDGQAARERYAQLVKAFKEEQNQVLERRQCRLAKLARAAAPGLTWWTGLLYDIAAAQLGPEGYEREEDEEAREEIGVPREG